VFNFDVPSLIDHPGPKLDRRDMALAHGTKADDHPETALGHTGLVRCGHDRRIGQRRPFDRILVKEVGTDEPPSVLIEFGVVSPMLHRREAGEKDLIEVRVTVGVLGAKNPESLRHLPGGKSERSVQYPFAAGYP